MHFNKKSIGLLETSALNHLSRISSHRQKKCATTCEEFKEFSPYIPMSFCLSVFICAKGQKVPLKRRKKNIFNVKKKCWKISLMNHEKIFNEFLLTRFHFAPRVKKEGKKKNELKRRKSVLRLLSSIFFLLYYWDKRKSLNRNFLKQH